MLSMKTFTCAATLIAVNCIALMQAGFTSHIGSGSYSAGFVGNYAGQLSGGQAVSELLLGKQEGEVESHDFSEGAAESSPSHYESLGSLGDHLSEHSFPADYGSEHFGSDDGGAASEYAEASEHHAEIEQHYQPDFSHSSHLNEVELGGDFHDDFDSKPVPGIDHGKGAFSYSSLYEFKKGEEE